MKRLLVLFGVLALLAGGTAVALADDPAPAALLAQAGDEESASLASRIYGRVSCEKVTDPVSGDVIVDIDDLITEESGITDPRQAGKAIGIVMKDHKGEVDPALGYLVDYGEIKAICDPIRKQLDHYYLNEIEGLENATSEILARWIWKEVAPRLPHLSQVAIAETCTSGCVYRGE